MPTKYYWTCLWPGLSELWWRGRFSGLSPAITFAVILNVLLILRFLYPNWLPSAMVSIATWAGIGIWLYLVYQAVRELPAIVVPRSVSDQPDRYADACQAYLRGDWGTAEPMLLKMLAIEPRDPPSLLLLSGVYRHTERTESADMLISELRRLEIADAWHLEIQAEVSRIQRDLRGKHSDDEEPSMPIEPSERSTGDSADLTAA